MTETQPVVKFEIYQDDFVDFDGQGCWTVTQDEHVIACVRTREIAEDVAQMLARQHDKTSILVR